MAKVIITLNATVQQLSNFADELGYQSSVVSGVDENGNNTFSDNPESKQEFLARILKKMTTEMLAEKAVQRIEREIKTEKENEKETVRSAMEKAISVLFG